MITRTGSIRDSAYRDTELFTLKYNTSGSSIENYQSLSYRTNTSRGDHQCFSGGITTKRSQCLFCRQCDRLFDHHAAARLFQPESPPGAQCCDDRALRRFHGSRRDQGV